MLCQECSKLVRRTDYYYLYGIAMNCRERLESETDGEQQQYKAAASLCQAFFNITVLLKSTCGHSTIANPTLPAIFNVFSNADFET
jgi:hypothetical protein